MNILITGGSGFFGHGLVRKLLKGNLSHRICIYSRDEYKQALMADRFNSDSRLRFFIGDVRDGGRLRQAMEGIDLVVHAAALKRIEVGRYNPEEMVKTNVGGALNVIDAATSAGVEKVVALSTDKAYQPVSPYGQTKALAESLFLNANNTRGRHGPRFAVVRYGNVSGSTGSVIPRWREAIKAGQGVRVTDPECTRFWMTVEEAVDLVLNTATTMAGGELAIPDLPAYRLSDLVTAMGLSFEVIGLPIYEKKHESMDATRSSDQARRMSVDEIREALETV